MRTSTWWNDWGLWCVCLISLCHHPELMCDVVLTGWLGYCYSREYRIETLWYNIIQRTICWPILAISICASKANQNRLLTYCELSDSEFFCFKWLTMSVIYSVSYIKYGWRTLPLYVLWNSITVCYTIY